MPPTRHLLFCDTILGDDLMVAMQRYSPTQSEIELPVLTRLETFIESPAIDKNLAAIHDSVRCADEIHPKQRAKHIGQWLAAMDKSPRRIAGAEEPPISTDPSDAGM
jgi:hypothetical protein